MNVQRIKDAFGEDLEGLLESLNITPHNLNLFIQLMLDEGFITEETHPWAFEEKDEELE